MSRHISLKVLFIVILIISTMITACSKSASNNIVEITPQTESQNTPKPTATEKLKKNIEVKGIYDIKKLFVHDNMPKRAEVWYSYYPTIEQNQYMADAIENGTTKIGCVKDHITESDVKALYDILNVCGIEVVESKPVYNTDFYISLVFDDYIVLLNANHDRVVNFQYINDTKDEYTIDGTIHSDELFKFIVSYANKDEQGFNFDSLKDTKSITMKYVIEQLNDETNEMLENDVILDITDSETISKIVDVLCSNSKPVSTHQSNEKDDIIFYTQDGIIYLKIKYVGASEWAETEPTFIVNGYYWFENSELYKLISTLEN